MSQKNARGSPSAIASISPRSAAISSTSVEKARHFTSVSRHGGHIARTPISAHEEPPSTMSLMTGRDGQGRADLDVGIFHDPACLAGSASMRRYGHQLGSEVSG
ncbi:hypothetical protein [Paracoccus mutanolyticus]|uniref:hypothetical protein n=1 Tax=Paracoccus mutanolyticus TaxID=1499308 RepID=UPI00167AA453|nr:hypothetical protein [Paracoccus mutanolyticus]